MGDNLTIIDWGTDFHVADICTGNAFTCVLSTNGSVKCCGSNGGGVGYGYSAQFGDNDGMGDKLAFIDLGYSFNTTSLKCGAEHICALSSELGVLQHFFVLCLKPWTCSCFVLAFGFLMLC